MNKSLLTHIIAGSILIASFFLQEPLKKYFYYASLFALSGALTNHLAIYMLFHKIPFLYGSGVIELNFEKFKSAIKELIMKEFFAREKVEHFIENEYEQIDFGKIVENLDYKLIYDTFKESIMQSKYAQLIQMIGGEKIFDSFETIFVKNMSKRLKEFIKSDIFQKNLKNQLTNSNLSEHFLKKIDIILQERLNELSAKEVRKIVENFIYEHLEWLVVWGGVIGGLIGVLAAFIE